ncbi:regulatory CAT8 [Fusarium pseudoanthophilum]|uniref:Regulatory CAT8 n=1 Tax=Fusarium pseudoanthophilum TaxID=48495 RepID=A0A8H5LG59_9HYPO|nr:regulatory CAT8 [Fusarium pseudoanthophilum]
MNYPPLLPRGPTSLSTEAVPTLAPKRRAVAVACDACRSRKVRCTGEFPTCAACQRRGAECNYADIANDREMHSNQLKRRVKELEDENRSLRNVFQSLRKRDGTTNQDLLQKIQAGDDFGTVIEHARDPGGQGKRKRSPSPSLMARQRPSDWTTIRGILPRTPVASPTAIYPIVLPVQASPSPPPLPSPPIDTPSSPKDAILGLLTLSQKEKPDLVLLNEARPKEHCDLRLNELSVSYWTRVPISNRSASTLISTFLETDNSAVGFINKDLFLTDLVQHNPTFCSAFLVSSILYLACFAHTASDGRAATLAHSFFNDAERLYRAERLSDSLTTLAAINIFSLGCFSHGNDNLGQDLLLSGRQMGDRMNFYGLDATSPEHDEERLAPLATVSETWQRIVEKHTFQNFRLSVQELPVFQSSVQRGRLQLVKSITLKVRTSPSWHEDCDWDIFQNILSSVVSSTTAIEVVRIERWWNVFGICDSRGGRTSNMELLDLISQAADHLEHIAVSYAVSADDFLDRCREVEFKKLRTLALTYRFNGIPSKKFSAIASQAVMRMPALEMLEVWELGLQGLQVHIFRLHPGISNAWKNGFAGREGYTLEIEEHRFARKDIATLSDMLPHLMLKDKILHASTRKRVSELTM